MYGTIARVHPKPGALAQLRAMTDDLNSARGRVPDGFVASYVFIPDEQPYERDTVFLVAIFEDKAKYDANADSPEQHEQFLQMRAFMEDDPDWMDGTFETA